jgi:hypothetical protein
MRPSHLRLAVEAIICNILIQKKTKTKQNHFSVSVNEWFGFVAVCSLWSRFEKSRVGTNRMHIWYGVGAHSSK